MLQKFDEKRYLDRLNLTLKVYELETGKRLGLTENIHCGGMKLITVRSFAIEETIQVIIEIPVEGITKKLTLTAVSCWSVLDTKTLTYDVGFRFLYSSAEMKSFHETLFDGLFAS